MEGFIRNTVRLFVHSFASRSFAIAIVLVRVVLIFRYRFDSDEPQHMHVAWGWAHGLIQYRDVFDNHMPLFHLLSAPIFFLSGDDVRVLFAARLAMLPLFFGSLLLTHMIASRLYGDRIASWAVVFLAAFPPYFLGTLEYRTDDLWVVLWLLAILIFVSDRPPLRKGAMGGFLIGLAFAVSLKSTLFVIALTVATVGTFLLTRKRSGIRAARDTARFAIASLVTAAIVPAAIYIGFAMAGAGNYFRYGVFGHNRFPYEHAWRVLWLIPLYFIIRPIALRMAAAEGPVPLVRRRLFLFLTSACFFTVLSAFWPMLSLESYLPFYPLAMILITPVLLDKVPALVPRLRLAPHLFASALTAAGLVAIIVTAAPWKNEARHEVELISEVLSLTSPGDRVMDQKGETIFRMRPYYLVLESITNRKLRLGLLRDRIAEALVRSATQVVASEALPKRSLRFVRTNYLPWGLVRVAGFRLPPLQARRAIWIDVRVPGRYVVVGNDRVMRAWVDGVDARDGVMLAVGRHQLVAADAAGRPLILSALALRGENFEARCLRAETTGEDPALRERRLLRELREAPAANAM